VVDEKIAKQLGIGGAKVFKIKDAIITPHRLSLLVSDGYKKIIVRNTDLETRKVSFIERDNLSDPYLVGLAEDVLNDCSDWKYPS
jgi:hypothetical protein